MATLFTSQLPWTVHLHVLARSLNRHFCPFSVSLISSPYLLFCVHLYTILFYFSWIHFTLEAWFYVVLLTVWRRLLKIISENNPASREWRCCCCCSLHINSLLPAYCILLSFLILFFCVQCVYIKFYLYAHVCFFLWRCIFQHNKY